MVLIWTIDQIKQEAYIMENNNAITDEELLLELEEVRNDKDVNWYFI